MTFIIDSHEDLGYLYLNYDRDVFRSVEETRQIEREKGHSMEVEGEALIGWPEYQKGQVAVVFGTLFVTPANSNAGEDRVFYRNPKEAHDYIQKQVDLYHRWSDTRPDAFHLITTKKDLKDVLDVWEKRPADYPKTINPVGLVISMEGAEMIGDISEVEEWWEKGVRLMGPVWAGLRFCGGTEHGGEFTPEGYQLLAKMNEVGYVCDVSHMNNISALQALDHYQGAVIASHSTVRRIQGDPNAERHLTDEAIHRLIERDGVIGVLPFNRFMCSTWKRGDAPLTIDVLVSHIDAICQMAGNSRHAAIGTDFDGGFGLGHVPVEFNSVGDLQKLGPALLAKGYSKSDVDLILGGNWRRILEYNLPG